MTHLFQIVLKTRVICEGRWIIPCSSCSERDSCIWDKAIWQPFTCTHRIIPIKELRECMKDKKLLFLGDSTNRGMMHYVIEKLNGTLSNYDKIHSFRIYTKINKGRTTVGFAYYPQFWLPVPQRPVFDKTIYKLLLKTQPLSNNSDTIIIVGGVHWLATQHLHTLIRILKREGLQGARLIIKTLGSGFHIPSVGVHHLPNEKQQKFLYHSLGLAAFAKYFHLDVVDTFNITVARYNDFYQGNCACHFHKLEEVQKPKRRYHVVGPVNAAYTEILLSRLCSS